MIMFKIFPTGVAVDTSKITAIFIDTFGVDKKKIYVVTVSCDGDFHRLIECKNEDDAKDFLKKLVDELNTMKGEFN